jgi:hypothetical protein
MLKRRFQSAGGQVSGWVTFFAGYMRAVRLMKQKGPVWHFFSPAVQYVICGIFQILWRKNGDVIANVLLMILPLASVTM